MTTIALMVLTAKSSKNWQKQIKRTIKKATRAESGITNTGFLLQIDLSSH